MKSNCLESFSRFGRSSVVLRLTYLRLNLLLLYEFAPPLSVEIPMKKHFFEHFLRFLRMKAQKKTGHMSGLSLLCACPMRVLGLIPI